MLATEEQEAAKEAGRFLLNERVPIAEHPDPEKPESTVLEFAQHKWRMKSVKNADKDAEGNKILDITRLHPELQGQPVSNEQKQQEKRERELVKKTLNYRYRELIQEKAAIGKNRIELKNDQRIIPYYYFWVDCTPERLKELIKQLKPWGIQVFAYPKKKQKPTRGSRLTPPGIGLGTPQGGLNTHTHTINHRATRRNCILGNRPVWT